jgi:hypothetical protein
MNNELEFGILKTLEFTFGLKTKKPQTMFEAFEERKTRLELATTSLEGWSSTN